MRQLPWLAVALMLGALAAGCGGSKRRADTPPSSNPYIASLAYARCLRAHGIPHPNPDRRGDFSLSRTEEQRLQRVPRPRRTAAMKACFHNLAGLSNQPLSQRAHRKAIRVLVEVKRCMHAFAYELGAPMVRNMSFGRAMFGFTRAARARAPSAKQERAELVCERRVGMARRISRIIDEDRQTGHGGY